MKKLKNVEKLGIAALVCLVLPVVALVEGARPQPETATFWISVGQSGEENVVLEDPIHFEVVTYIDGWGEDDFWNAKLGGGGFLNDELGGEFTVDIPEYGAPCVPYQGDAYLGYLFHQHRCKKIVGDGKPYRLYEDYWTIGIYWYADVDGLGGEDDKVMLIVETDRDSAGRPVEWQYAPNLDTSTAYFWNRPFSIVWYRYEEREIGRSGKMVGEWNWQGYLWKNTEHPDQTITVTVTIEKQP